MYIDRQTGTRCARHRQFRLGRLPVFVEKDQDGNALPGTEYVGYPQDPHVNQPSVAQNASGRCPGLHDTPMTAGGWRHIVRHWLNANPKRSVLVVDISDPVYSW
jgi:hypothetical protein